MPTNFPGVRAHYTFKNSGTLGLDRSGNSNTLIAASVKPQPSVAGKHAGALHLSGSTTLTVSGFPKGVPTNNSPYTIACWFKPDAGCPLNASLIGWGIDQNGKVNFLRIDSGTSKIDNHWWFHDLMETLAGGSFYRLRPECHADGLCGGGLQHGWHFQRVDGRSDPGQPGL